MKYITFAIYAVVLVIINVPGYIKAKLTGKPYEPVGGPE